jgi:hypothetical protein
MIREKMSPFGVPIPALPMGLTWIRDIEYYDGPLLAEYEGDDGNRWLKHWCDCDDKANRWMLTKSSQEYIDAYMAKQKPLLALFKEQNVVGFLEDQSKNGSRYYSVILDYLPWDYFPEPGAMYAEELDPAKNGEA